MDSTARISAARRRPKFPWRKAAVRTGLGAVGLLLLVLAAGLVFSSFLINRWLKPGWVKAFAAAHPGTVLRVDKMHYRPLRNVTLCEGVSVTSSNAGWSCRAQTLSLTGIPWLNFILGERRPAKVLAQSIVQADDLVIDFNKTQYRLHCRSIRGSAPGSEIRAQDLELRPRGTDEEFFAARDYRRARFHLRAPRVLVSGIHTDDLLEGKFYRAKSIELEAPNLDALINHDKPLNQHPRKPLMPHEAMAGIRQSLQVDAVEVTNGRMILGERAGVGQAPGVLTFDGVSLAAKGIANHSAGHAPVFISGQAMLMNSGQLQATMELPLAGPDLSLRYAASLGPFDLRTLNPFLAITARTRINAAVFRSAACEISVSGDHARGRFEALYGDIDVTMLDRETGSETGIWNRLKSIFVDKVALRTSNPAGKSVKVGVVDYTRKPEEKFLLFVWFAARSGIFDLLGLSPYAKAAH